MHAFIKAKRNTPNTDKLCNLCKRVKFSFLLKIMLVIFILVRKMQSADAHDLRLLNSTV